jgi:hypothetical protein
MTRMHFPLIRDDLNHLPRRQATGQLPFKSRNRKLHIHMDDLHVDQDLLLAECRTIFRFVECSNLWHHQCTMRTNQNMRAYLSHLQAHESALSPELSSVLAAGFVEEKGCVLLASEARHPALTRAATQEDETGYECFINHLHVESLAEALEFGRRLNRALAECFTDCFVVIVAFDGREATVRFHKIRAGQTWLNEDLEGYSKEGVAVLDSG